MSQYDQLDKAIVAAIKQGKNPIYDRGCINEATRIERETGRYDFRIIDGRLQHLRKRGDIAFLKKKEAQASGRNPGWNICEPKEASK